MRARLHHIVGITIMEQMASCIVHIITRAMVESALTYLDSDSVEIQMVSIGGVLDTN
jgi:hypothetical protein